MWGIINSFFLFILLKVLILDGELSAGELEKESKAGETIGCLIFVAVEAIPNVLVAKNDLKIIFILTIVVFFVVNLSFQSILVSIVFGIGIIFLCCKVFPSDGDSFSDFWGHITSLIMIFILLLGCSWLYVKLNSTQKQCLKMEEKKESLQEELNLIYNEIKNKEIVLNLVGLLNECNSDVSDVVNYDYFGDNTQKNQYDELRKKIDNCNDLIVNSRSKVNKRNGIILSLVSLTYAYFIVNKLK